MADPLTLSGVAWGISIAGWIISPIFARLVNKAFSYTKSDKSETLHHLLSHTLPRLALTLEGVEALHHRKLFEVMVKDLKSAFYDMEEILDEVEYIRIYKQLNAQRKRKFSLDDNAGPSNQSIGIESSQAITGNLNSLLKDSMKNIQNIIDNAEKTIQLTKLGSYSHSDNHRPYVTAQKVVQTPTVSDPAVKVTGRDEDRDLIRKLLRDTNDIVNANSNETPCFSAIGIYGISGSGKTTLAQYVCKSEKEADYFDLVMWIHVTQNFSAGTIFKEMFEAASGNNENSCSCPPYNNLDVLRKELEKKLHKKRFLLVLDDIWCNKDASEQNLPLLVSPLKVGGRGSKIIATSRNADAFVDLGPDVRCATMPIPDLNDDVFFEMFMHYALGSSRPVEKDQRNFERIGAEIAQKLKVSPLAACTLGGHLRKRKEVEFWRSVRDSHLLNETMGVLLWSYQHLDEHVRRCFAYCSIFPKRYCFRREKLVNLWVSEGFIKSNNAEEDVEFVGHQYFHELVSTSFLQQNGGDYLIHDLLHDLAEKVAGSDCLRLENGWDGEFPEDVRHVFVKTSNGHLITDKIVKMKKLRTLIIHIGGNYIIGEKTIEKIIINSSKLRVLDVLHFGPSPKRASYGFSFPDCIGVLKHLRYLGFETPWVPSPSGDRTLILPATISKLYHLQVLDFRNCLELVCLPSKDMINAINLQRVLLNHGTVLHIRNIGRLTSLREIPYFRVSKEEGCELRQLKHLNKLEKKT